LRIEPARYDAPLDLEGARRIVNVGSVGQPRDGDPAARYAILDLDRRTLEWRRVPYEVAKTQEKIRRVGLPDILWMRLAYGR
jgi:diadenosine tetraphosphatase ApaH/serine/threonine PP2A family protein phosphatase